MQADAVRECQDFDIELELFTNIQLLSHPPRQRWTDDSNFTMHAPQTIGRIRPSKPKRHARAQKRKRDDVDAEKLQQAIEQLEPHGSYASFSDLPLSAPTREGLESAHFSTLTDIQAKAIPRALQGSDILGAARTGSGKTLAFVIPVLENLYRSQCVGPDAGLGAMIISPTRELAIQIFDVLRKVGGKGHLFAAGLVIGGKSLREERDALTRMNIVVCTPGRILQHLSQTAAFNVDNLQMLVLDEADRIMDMGFRKDVDAIIDYLPSERQTLLFSATQTKRVSDLSRLALKNPEYISVHEAASTSTPKSLQQNYVITPLPEKLDTLWSFLQSSKKSKILVFLSSGKQVRFVYESFRHMQPGIPLLHLHGRQKQTARLEITQRFSQAKYSCLFATDVVARGLDFPSVDWVIQVDCPEDADTYIHRVGRTARYEKAGRAVLFLDPTEEEGMLSRLEQKRVPIEKINVRTKKQTSIKNQLQSMCFKDPSLKYLGQKAFSSYVRSLHVQKDKDVFKLDAYPLEDFAASLGLPGAPRIKFLKADPEEVKKLKNKSRQEMAISESEDEAEEGPKAAKNPVRTKYDRMFERQNQDVLASHYAKMVRNEDTGPSNADALDGEQEADDALFDVKRRIPAGAAYSSDDESSLELDYANHAPNEFGEPKTVVLPGASAPLILDSRRREKLLKSKKKLLKLKDKGSKVVFDDDGIAHQLYELEDEDDFKARGAADEQRTRFLQGESERVRIADEGDKRVAKEKRKEKREKRKRRDKEAEEGGAMDEGGEDEGNQQNLMANFLADAESASERESETTEPKRRRKWFEREAVAQDGNDAGREIGTLDELEAEAARLLA